MNRLDPRFRPGMSVFAADEDFERLEEWTLIGPCQANSLWIATRNGETRSFSESMMSVNRHEGLLLLAGWHSTQAQNHHKKARRFRAEALGRPVYLGEGRDVGPLERDIDDSSGRL